MSTHSPFNQTVMRGLLGIIKGVRDEINAQGSELTADWMHEFLARRAAERAQAYLEQFKQNRTIIDYTIKTNGVLFISFLSIFEGEVYRIAMPVSAI